MIVLDTHAWLWWVGEPEKLSRTARDRIQQASILGVCAISCWEVAMLVAKGRLTLDRDPLVWLRQAVALPNVRLIALTPEISAEAALLIDVLPGDPADHMIVATSRHLNAPLVSKDGRIRSYGGDQIVW